MDRFAGIAFDIEPPINQKDTFFCIISKEIDSKESLFNTLSRLLVFPNYFGSNWDALYDCLCDFHWISAYRVVIAHNILPKLSPAEMQIYLNILCDAIDVWQSDGGHLLEIQFRQDDESRVASFINQYVDSHSK